MVVVVVVVVVVAIVAVVVVVVAVAVVVVAVVAAAETAEVVIYFWLSTSFPRDEMVILYLADLSRLDNPCEFTVTSSPPRGDTGWRRRRRRRCPLPWLS